VTIQVARDRRSQMRHEAHIGHDSCAAVSLENGGQASGPSPHDLYDAALGACTALTVLGYAKLKNIPVEHISVSVARDAGQERTGLYRLSAVLTLTGDLSAEQRQDLLRAAEQCPIHRLMTDVTTEIVTTLSS
jgi:putative redox protein